MAKAKKRTTKKKPTARVKQIRKPKGKLIKLRSDIGEAEDKKRQFELKQELDKIKRAASKKYPKPKKKEPTEADVLGKYLDADAIDELNKFKRNPHKKFFSQLMKDADTKYKYHYVNYKRVSKAQFKRLAMLFQQWILKKFGKSLTMWKYEKTANGKININLPIKN